MSCRSFAVLYKGQQLPISQQGHSLETATEAFAEEFFTRNGYWPDGKIMLREIGSETWTPVEFEVSVTPHAKFRVYGKQP